MTHTEQAELFRRFAASLRMAADFEAQMRHIQDACKTPSEPELERLKASIQALGASDAR